MSEETINDLPAESDVSHNFMTELLSKEVYNASNKEAAKDQLNKTISQCKQLVLKTDQYSEKRKMLVRDLIELQIQLQEFKDSIDDSCPTRYKSSSVSKRAIKCHHLVLQTPFNIPNSKYCDHCTASIWYLVQTWYQCENCGFSCHYKCLSQIVRECAHTVVSEKGNYELDICPENGLSAQKYKCGECKCQLLLETTNLDVRKCDYTGLYYCAACHWGGEAIIPARVIHNWDFSLRPVCQASLQQLKVTATRPLIKLKKLNPKLFDIVLELKLVDQLREKLNSMRKYILVCRLAQEDHLLWKNTDRPHMLETSDLYSLQDLVDTHSGEIVNTLQTLIQLFSDHIKIRCEICQGHAHICDICNNDEFIFPFDSTAHICNKCFGVTHKQCYERKSKCLKCERQSLRLEKNV